MNRSTRIVLLALLPAALTATSDAQAFRPGFEAAGTSGGVFALASHTDLTGTHLYAAGEFDAAGSAVAGQIARWNGLTLSWFPLAQGTNGRVGALASFDEDGAGGQPARLYAGGSFTQAGPLPANNVARWTGSAWTSLTIGTNDWVTALTTYDPDGTGPAPAALYVGGLFTTAGGVLCNHIARWNGTTWSALASGLDGPVTSMLSFDADGTGPQQPQLYVGGLFTHAGALLVNGLARWNGTSWLPVGPGVTDSESAATVNAMAVFDEDGLGPQPGRLFLGGTFKNAGIPNANGIVRWDGLTFSPLANGISATNSFPNVRALTVFNDGGGDRLYAAGLFRTAGSVVAVPDGNNPNPLLIVARWDGVSWQPLGPGIASSSNSMGRALVGFDDTGGGTKRLFVGGLFTVTGNGGTSGVARWNGSAWTALGTGRGADGDVNSIASFGSPGAPILVGGSFKSVGTTAANRVALWNDQAQVWQPMGPGVDATVHAVAIHNSAMYAGGDFETSGGAPANHVAQFTGSSWSDLGGGTNGRVLALASYQGRLIAGGEFGRAGPGSAQHIAAWDGGGWQPLSTGTDDTVRALAVFDDSGTGVQHLFAAGDFLRAGGMDSTGVARWDGAVWTPMGSGLCCGGVYALAVYDDGAGPRLYAAGDIDLNGDQRIDGVVRWNFATQHWDPTGTGFSGGRSTSVRAIATAVIGGAPVLVAGGDFDIVNGINARNIARWNGSGWTPFGSGMDDVVLTLRSSPVFPSGEALFVGGTFTLADGLASSHFARSN